MATASYLGFGFAKFTFNYRLMIDIIFSSDIKLSIKRFCFFGLYNNLFVFH